MKATDIWNRLFALKAITAIEIIIEQDGNWITNMIDLKVKKNNPVVSGHQVFQNQAELFDHLPSKAPLCLIINGKGVLKKRIQLQGDGTADELLNQVFPNARKKDFYVHIQRNEEHHYDVTIARRSVVEDIIKKFTANNILVVELYIGDYFIKANTSFKDHNLNKDQLLAAAGAYHFLVDQKAKPSSQSTSIRRLWLDHYYGRLFKHLGMVFLIMCLGSLLINFLAFDHYNKQLAELSGKGDQISSQMRQYDNLKGELSRKKQLLRESGFEGVSRISFYLDRIASSRSKGIALTKIDINPKQDGLRNDDFLFNKGEILITGQTNSSLQLNKWVNRLKEYDWAKNVKIVGYNHISKDKNAEFQLSINIKS